MRAGEEFSLVPGGGFGCRGVEVISICNRKGIRRKMIYVLDISRPAWCLQHFFSRSREKRRNGKVQTRMVRFHSVEIEILIDKECFSIGYR